MHPEKKPFKKIAELLAFGAMTGILFAGCGGGGSGNTAIISGAAPYAADTALGSYISDGQGTGFSGNWFTSSVASAVANTRTLAATGSPTVFNVTYFSKSLANGSWSDINFTQGGGYGLTPTGWATGSQNGQTLTDIGDGSNAVLNISNGDTYPFSIVKTSLAGSPVVCTNGPCSPSSATYPAGAARYSLSYTSAHYFLLTSTNGYQVTNQYGAPFTSLPTLNDTFCDPLLGYVYKPQSTATYTSNYYWVYYAANCGSAAISTALAGTHVAYVMVSVEPTGNAYVPNVLILTNWTPGYGLLNPWIYALRAGYVWEGLKEPQGTNFTLKNKAAINAELLGSGYSEIP